MKTCIKEKTVEKSTVNLSMKYSKKLFTKEEILEQLLSPDSDLKSITKKDEYGEYIEYNNIDFDGFNGKEISSILKEYLSAKFLNSYIKLDKDKIKVTNSGIKKMTRYTKNNADKSMVELEKIARISKYKSSSENTKNLEQNAPTFKYYDSRIKIGNKMINLRLIVKVPYDANQESYIYSVQTKKEAFGTLENVAPTDLELNQSKIGTASASNYNICQD